VSETGAALQRAGQRLTPQRLAIADALARTGKEATVQELYEQVRRRHPYIGRATIFRAVDMLVDAGLAQRLERPGHVSAYVWCAPGHHHHLACTSCRSVEDLDEAAVMPLLDAIARRHGFRVDHATLNFYGECRSCRN
jgi:Fur family ferric uptake transcriptional regulator